MSDLSDARLGQTVERLAIAVERLVDKVSFTMPSPCLHPPDETSDVFRLADGRAVRWCGTCGAWLMMDDEDPRRIWHVPLRERARA